MSKWIVKHGNKVYKFKTKQEALKEADFLNKVFGYNFTIVKKG